MVGYLCGVGEQSRASYLNNVGARLGKRNFVNVVAMVSVMMIRRTILFFFRSSALPSTNTLTSHFYMELERVAFLFWFDGGAQDGDDEVSHNL